MDAYQPGAVGSAIALGVLDRGLDTLDPDEEGLSDGSASDSDAEGLGILGCETRLIRRIQSSCQEVLTKRASIKMLDQLADVREQVAGMYGLLFNEQGARCTQSTAVSLVVDLLLVDDQLEARVDEIAPLIESSGWIAPQLGSSTPTPTLEEVVEKALDAASRLPAEVRDKWTRAWER